MKLRSKSMSRSMFLSILVLVAVFFISPLVMFANSSSPNQNIGGFLPLIKPAFAQAGDAAFLEQEAGIGAYLNVGQPIDPTTAKTAFRTIEKETGSYIIGSVALPGYGISDDVHCFVHRDGWIVAYYMKNEPTSKIVDWLGYSGGQMTSTKLRMCLTVVGSSLGVQLTGVKYYHFAFPNANKLMIAVKSSTYDLRNESTLWLTVPSGLFVYDRSWSFYVEKKDWAESPVTHYGSLTASQLMSDTRHTVSLYWHEGNPVLDMTLDGTAISTVKWPIYSGYADRACMAVAAVYKEPQ
jgi:hypothetical protein